jgi:hypothetical protein
MCVGLWAQGVRVRCGWALLGELQQAEAAGWVQVLR